MGRGVVAPRQCQIMAMTMADIEHIPKKKGQLYNPHMCKMIQKPC